MITSTHKNLKTYEIIIRKLLYYLGCFYYYLSFVALLNFKNQSLAFIGP